MGCNQQSLSISLSLFLSLSVGWSENGVYGIPPSYGHFQFKFRGSNFSIKPSGQEQNFGFNPGGSFINHPTKASLQHMTRVAAHFWRIHYVSFRKLRVEAKAAFLGAMLHQNLEGLLKRYPHNNGGFEIRL